MMKGVIFDLGHTLMSFEHDWKVIFSEGQQALQDFLKQHHSTIPDAVAQHFDEIRQKGHVESDRTNVEYTAESAFLDSLEKFGLNGKFKNLMRQALDTYFASEINHWNAYPESLEILETLKKLEYHVGLISNAQDHPFILRCVKRLGFESFLNPIISSAAFHVRKPHPDIFLHVAKLWNLEPKQIAMVGDQPYFDVYGAHQVGMKGIWIKRNTDKAHTYIPENLKDHPWMKPDATVETLHEVISALESFHV